MEQKDYQLDAVLDRNLRKLIAESGLINPLEMGELRCPECNKQITFENIGAIKVLDENLILICDDQNCILEAGQK